MCVVSFVGDHYHDKWADPFWPRLLPWPYPIPQPVSIPTIYPIPPLTNEEIVQRAIKITQDLAKAENKFPASGAPRVDDQVELDLAIKDHLQKQVDTLKQEVAEMRELLKRAKKYDDDNNEPDCEIDEKMDLLRKVARAIGIDLDDVIGKKND